MAKIPVKKSLWNKVKKEYKVVPHYTGKKWTVKLVKKKKGRK